MMKQLMDDPMRFKRDIVVRIRDIAILIVSVLAMFLPHISAQSAWTHKGIRARYGHSQVFDPGSGKLIVFGGQHTISFGNVNDAFWGTRIAGSTELVWTPIMAAQPPKSRFGHTAVYDSANARMVVFGGGLGSSTPAPCQNEVWLLQNANGVAGSASWSAQFPGSAYTYSYATLGEIFAWIIGWDLILEYAMGASTVSSGWSNHFIELLNIFNVKMPLWLAYDHWTGLKTAEQIIARQMTLAQNPNVLPGTQDFIDKMNLIVTGQSAELVTRAHALLGAPTIFGHEIGFNLPAFVIALVITAILVVGIKESAGFNSTIVVIKVSVVLFVIFFGMKFVNFSNWGTDWHSFAPYGAAGIGAGAAYIFFAYIGFDAVSTTAQEAKNPQ